MMWQAANEKVVRIQTLQADGADTSLKTGPGIPWSVRKGLRQLQVCRCVGVY